MKKINWDNFKDDREILDYLKALPRYKNNTFKSLYRRTLFFLNLIIYRVFKLSKPLFIVLVTNNGCNLRCTYCYGNYGERNTPDYSTKEFIKIVDELKELGTKLLTVHGGESLLRSDIGEILNYIKLKGFYTSLNTNGYLVPNKIDQIKIIDAVSISLDGSRESNDKNRGKGCFDKVEKAIEVFQKNNIPVNISVTLTKDNMNDMDFLAEYGLKKKCRIQYSILYNSDEIKNKSNNLVMNDSEIRQIVKKILDLKKQGYPIYYAENVFKTAIEWPFSYADRPFVRSKKELPRNFKPIPCYHGILKYYIDANGRVLLCWDNNFEDAPNIKKMGVAKAIKECHERYKDTCKYCSFLANNEQNSLMDLNPRNIIHTIGIQLRDALKLKS